jgi:hypothetical protein
MCGIIMVQGNRLVPWPTYCHFLQCARSSTIIHGTETYFPNCPQSLVLLEEKKEEKRWLGMSAIDKLSLNGPCIRHGKDMPVSREEKGRKSESDRSTQTVLVDR